MDILKRSISNITDEAWAEIDTQAVRVLKATLSARKFVDVLGPFGWDYAAFPLGKLRVPKEGTKDEVRFGIHQVMPLVESRAFFELDVWELDNITRGSKNPDLGPLEEAVRKIALFEEKAIYQGMEEACILGISQVSTESSLKGTLEKLLDTLTKAVIDLQKKSVEGPYALIADQSLWQYILARSGGYPLKKSIETLLDGGIILSPNLEGSYVVSMRGGDMEMVLGQDFSIGYHSGNKEKVKLFITESFTFRVVNPEAIVPINI
ncbi:MAG: bacteriocin family protein [Synergistales bacterium]|nr:bacteriocin family protein [Synergistales bacterium]